MLQERIISLVEVLLLAGLFFGLLTSIRGTRGAGILKGTVFFIVIAFLGLMWLSNIAGLDRIKLLLQYVLAGSVVAVIIIFAPELRRGLLRLAQAPYFAQLIHGPSLKVADEITSAAVKLSKNRIGALIAIEREVGLGEYIENGQKLDAVLSSELLESIFYPGNPLHDGAVVIQHEQIAAAACLFPLPEDPTLSRTMGTRHRAAIGISEETDAIAIVVSEETGRISVCVGGKMTGDLTKEALDKTLRELYTRSGRNTLSFRWGRKTTPPPPEEVAGGEPPGAAEPPPAEPAVTAAAPPAATPETDTRKRRKGESRTRLEGGEKEKRTA